jgi:putative hydrolase of the HAD superfamily
MDFKVLVFDFFGVICSEIAPFWLARHFSPADAVAIKSDLVHAADIGSLSEQDMFAALSQLSKVPADRINSEWHALVQIDRELVKLIEQFRSSYRIALLTNSPSPFVRSILQQYGLAPLFETITVSSEIGCAKPERGIYEKLLSDCLVSPYEALMIDDNPANITGAVAVGMAAIEYKSRQQLQKFIDNSDK